MAARTNVGSEGDAQGCFAWGEAFQFDWSEEGLVVGGLWRKVQLAHMKLCASRAFGWWRIRVRATRCSSTRARAV